VVLLLFDVHALFHLFIWVQFCYVVMYHGALSHSLSVHGVAGVSWLRAVVDWCVNWYCGCCGFIQRRCQACVDFMFCAILRQGQLPRYYKSWIFMYIREQIIVLSRTTRAFPAAFEPDLSDNGLPSYLDPGTTLSDQLHNTKL
jgi:hypothetical protein